MGIGCDATHKIFQKDVFLLRSSLSGQNVSTGSLLSFKAQMSPKGPQAYDVMILPPGCISLDGAESTQAFAGTIKSWNQEKGFGFIEGDELRQTFNKDIFLHKREIGVESLAPS